MINKDLLSQAKADRQIYIQGLKDKYINDICNLINEKLAEFDPKSSGIAVSLEHITCEHCPSNILEEIIQYINHTNPDINASLRHGRDLLYIFIR